MKNDINIIQVVSKNAPVITIDPFTQAIYIKFSSNKIVKTLDETRGASIVNFDLDAKNDVVGVELIGVRQFSIQKVGAILSKRISNLPDLTKAKIEASAELPASV